MNQKIGMIPYSNMGPYRELPLPEGFEFINFFPRESTEKMRKGEIIAAAMPVGDFLTMREIVKPLGHYGIAAEGKVNSVFLFSKYPLSELGFPRSLELTTQSSTSVRLLFLLLKEKLKDKKFPRLATPGEEPSACLIIGDDALLARKNHKWKFVIDLAEEWYKSKHLPFVFARWVIHKNAKTEEEEYLLAWLQEFAKQENDLVKAASAKEAKRLNLGEEEMFSYLQGMTRVFSKEELAGERLFLQELEELEEQPLFQPYEAANA